MRRIYDIDLSVGVGGTPPPVAPKGYAVTTPDQRTQWNGFLDYAAKQKADFNNPQTAALLMAQYKKGNPSFSLTPNDLARIQYEHYQLRQGNQFGSLNQQQLNYIRQGLQQGFLGRQVGDMSGKFTPETAKLYYPTEGNFGTDLEGYYNSKFKPAPAANVPVSGPIPRPDFNDPVARGKYLKTLAAQPGNSFLHGRGDYVLNVNKVPQYGNKTFHDSTIEAAQKVGLDPALLYSSAQEEGASGLVPDEKGSIATAEETNPEYPVNGFANYGLDNFHDNFKEMVKRGYLPKDFDYKPEKNKNEMGQTVNSAIFRNTEDAMKAKAAYVRMEQDNLEDWSKKNDVKMSPLAKQFFTLIAFNGGPGRAHILLNYYKKKGLLDGDKFLQNAPDKSVDPGGAYGHILPRYQVSQLLKKEGYF